MWVPAPDANQGPLRGLRVIEFGQLIAGPYAGMLLGDFGADVIKVEPPEGDAMREWGRDRHDGHSLWWSLMARNKRSVMLDLHTPDGRRRALELCATADVVVENFRPGTMERWGLGPDEVHERNPRCVYARVSGYGQTGRYRDRPGFASAGEALAGLRYINGYPGQAPPRFGISLGDTLAAQSAFQGVLLALYARDARGASGQVVDASIADACFAMLESAVAEYELSGDVREPSGSIIPRIAPSNIYRSSDDRWVVIAANHDTLWHRLAELIGHPELADDPRFATHDGARRAPGGARRRDRRLGGRAHRRGARPDRQRRRRRVRARELGRRDRRGPVLPRARAAGDGRRRGARADVGARRRPEAERHARRACARRRAGRSARTRTRSRDGDDRGGRPA